MEPAESQEGDSSARSLWGSMLTEIGRRRGDDVLYYIIHQIFWLAIAYFTLYLVYVLLTPGIYDLGMYWGRRPYYWGRTLTMPTNSVHHSVGHYRSHGDPEMLQLAATVDEAVRIKRH